MNKTHPLEFSFYDQMTVWAFRISRVSDLDLETTFVGFMKPKPIPERLVISEETSSAGILHHHGLIAWETSPDKPRDYLNGLIKEIYPDAKGNSCIYIRQSLDKNQLLKYTLKEGLFKVHGFSAKYIADALVLSSKKEDMKGSFDRNVDAYLLGTINFKKFMTKHIDLKVSHKQPLYTNHLLAYFRSVAMRKGDIKSEDYADVFYEKIIYNDKC